MCCAVGCAVVCWLCVLQEETGITHVADPWGGSYFMESLTAQLESAAEALLQEVEGLGGMTEALLAGGARGCWQLSRLSALLLGVGCAGYSSLL
jgi:hypothetical protein